MGNTVMAVFSGTRVTPGVFEAARHLAREQQARLVLLTVRHLQQANRLAEVLARKSFLGRGAVEQLQGSVKAERSKAIGRALAAMEAEARRDGLDVQVVEVKGEFVSEVDRVAREMGAAILVLEAATERKKLPGPYRVVPV